MSQLVHYWRFHCNRNSAPDALLYIQLCILHACFISLVKTGASTAVRTFNGGTGRIAFGSVGCTGAEESLFDCPSSAPRYYYCSHSRDIGVRCYLQTGMSKQPTPRGRGMGNLIN